VSFASTAITPSAQQNRHLQIQRAK